ncbi:hypothetical protein AVEN_246384-1 [Araneus ventricosus]|uniref:Uncharacterized protein n=1 Tax=Araneus ventricosus TaxID=182803 RepID=A0A4Y2RZ26_ARAVE|nr:hypothetical protein AVEN_246384-1 [Araneus ventricosus]
MHAGHPVPQHDNPDKSAEDAERASLLDLVSNPLLTLDFLRVHRFMDLIQICWFSGNIINNNKKKIKSKRHVGPKRLGGLGYIFKPKVHSNTDRRRRFY